MRRRIKDDDDYTFLFTLFSQNKRIELGWQFAEPALIDPILEMQWNARIHYYNQKFPLAICYIFLLNNTPVGQLTVQHEQDHIHIIDISVLHDYQNQGIGSAIIKDLQMTAKQTNHFITLHVSTSNSAHFLYLNLGFFDTQYNETDIKMKWVP